MSTLWLDEDYYLQQQLSRIQAANPDSSITTTSALLTALSEEGQTVAQNFIEIGWKNGLDPSAGFVPNLWRLRLMCLRVHGSVCVTNTNHGANHEQTEQD